jgi:peptidoglycan/xylan/chitin deacetylase (PgdA/CDA1 family)
MAALASAAEIPAKLVVLTCDDAVKSHRTFIAPLLKELGFGATFFVTHLWMNDAEHFMNWSDIGELHELGFEIGNHSWTHADFSVPRNAARLAGELSLVENELKKVNVPKPVSFAYSGNFFGPEALKVLRQSGYRFARRGGSPEVEYGTLQIGPTYIPNQHDPLLIPTTGDAYPKWTLEHFVHVVSHARPGHAVVLQFHGVPDVKHPWVHTPPENFRKYMIYLKRHNFRVIPLRQLEQYLDREHPPADPMTKTRHRQREEAKLEYPVEVAATRRASHYWLKTMLGAHQFSRDEAANVFDWTEAQVEAASREITASPASGLEVRPYPGGRPVRIGFRDGAIDPLRGTKASVFLPWSPKQYVVVDLPEAIFSNLGLLFLAHTHVPTIWNAQNLIIENVDWDRSARGLRSLWRLPNGVRFGATIAAERENVSMELTLHNGTSERLGQLRTQICVLLKGAPDFYQQTTTNKIFGKATAAVHSADQSRWILTEWDRCGRTWGNAQCPCLHSDPVFPDCAPGETVSVAGRLWFVEGGRPPIA